FPARLIRVAGDLDPVHPQVRTFEAGGGNALGVDLRQGDKGPAVKRPGLELREQVERRLVGQDRSSGNIPGEQRQCRGKGRCKRERVFQGLAGIHLEGYQSFYARQGVAKDKAGPLQGSEQVTQHWEAAPLRVGKKKSGPPLFVDPPLDRPHLQIGINLYLYSFQATMTLQIGYTLLQISVAHALSGEAGNYRPSTTRNI